MSHEQPRVLKPKTKEELQKQVGEASERVGARVTPLFENGSVLNLSPEKLKEHYEKLKESYPDRYAVYLKTLRAARSGRIIPPKEAKLNRLALHTASLDEYITRHWDNNGERTLRVHQMTVLEKIKAFLEKGRMRGYINLPTGTGKTVLFAELVEALGARALVLVPTVDLVDQTLERFQEFAKEVDLGIYHGGEKRFGSNGVIMTIQSFTQLMRQGRLNPLDYQLVIVDEAHHALTELRKEALRPFAHALQFGFTATPVLAEEKKVEELYPACIHRMGLREAVRRRLLAPVVAKIVRTNVDLSEVRIEHGDFNLAALEKAVNQEARNRMAIRLYAQEYQGRRAVVFCTTIAHARAVEALFAAQTVDPTDPTRRIRTAMVSSQSSDRERKRVLAEFKKGNIDVLCNVDVLTEGFDDPGVSVCINLRPTCSPRIAEQRGGRVLRLDPNNPAKQAVVIDFVDRLAAPDNGRDRNRQGAGRHTEGQEQNEGERRERPRPVLFADILQGDRSGGEGEREGRRGDEGDGRRAPTIALTGGSIPDATRIEEEEIGRVEQDKAMPEATEKAPKGWMTVYDLALKVGGKSRYHRTLNVVEAERVKRPDSFGYYLDGKNRTRLYVAPDMCEKLERQIVSEKPAPEGWKTFDECRVKGMFTVTLHGRQMERYGRARILIQEHLREHPEQSGMFLDDQGRYYRFYAPELFNLIEARIKSEKEAPDGWKTRRELAGEYEKDVYEKVSNFVRRYHEPRPGWFQMGMTRNGTWDEHLAPELTNRIRKRLDDEGYVRRPPRALPKEQAEGLSLRKKGWRTFTEIMQEVSKPGELNRLKTRRLVEEAIRELPNEVRRLPSITSKESTLHSPNIFARVREMSDAGIAEIEARGWVTLEQIVGLFVPGAQKRVLEIARDPEQLAVLERTYPKAMKNLGLGRIYYGPEIADMIWRRILRRSATGQEQGIAIQLAGRLGEAERRRLQVILERNRRGPVSPLAK